jgi:hypothetical protein
MGEEYVGHICIENGDWVLYSDMDDEKNYNLDAHAEICEKYKNALLEIAETPGCPQCVYVSIKRVIGG